MQKELSTYATMKIFGVLMRGVRKLSRMNGKKGAVGAAAIQLKCSGRSPKSL